MQKFINEPARKTPVIEADVFVAGAGTAGCVAAIAAARAGAKTILVEKTPVPGGTYTNGGSATFSFFSSNMDPDKAVRIVDGIPYEMISRIDKMGGFTGFIPMPNEAHMCPFRAMSDHEVYKTVAAEMLLEAGVEVYLQTMLSDVIVEDGAITAAIIENKNGRSAVVAKQYIDATGDGDVAKYAGVERVEKWSEYTKVCSAPTALVFGMGGIDFEKVFRENPEAAVPRLYPDGRIFGMAFHHTVSPRYDKITNLNIAKYVSFHSLHEHEATYINCFKGPVIDGSDAVAFSKAELELRVRNYHLAQAFKECVPGFENAYLNWHATQLGVRNSWITLCDKILSEKEIENATRFDNEIGLYGFHDLRAKRPDCTIQEPGFYGLPYDMLLAKGCKNLFMAGRCITVDIEAHMSTRNTISCMVMGQGAGVAAALCADKDCASRELAYGDLKAKLLEQKVLLDA